jgi:hypothetical protein
MLWWQSNRIAAVAMQFNCRDSDGQEYSLMSFLRDIHDLVTEGWPSRIVIWNDLDK